MKRRDFLNRIGLGGLATILPQQLIVSCKPKTTPNTTKFSGPRVVSTWSAGLEANKASWDILSKGGAALDAVEAGVKVTESDAKNHSVGLGGLPDRDGHVTLDACIMDHNSRCGSVAYLENIEHPISVARKVMEETPHVMLVGKGAEQFAYEMGFPKIDLLTPEAKAEWEKWKEQEDLKKPEINHENHDTIGLLAIDEQGNLSGACTTSGWAYKLPGRVGDSPIIGAGLFVDNEVGAACATGLGEAVIRIAGSHTVVELMRHGYSPFEACKEAVDRIKSKHDDLTGLQVGFLAMNKAGEVGAFSMYQGFNYAQKDNETEELVDAQYHLEWD